MSTDTIRIIAFRKEAREAYLKPLHAVRKTLTHEAREIVSTKEDPKDLCFIHVAKVKSTHQPKSFFAEISYKHLGRVEENLKEHMEENDSAYVPRILSHTSSL